MRNIVLGMSVSLDGYFEGPDHDISWHRVDEELHQHMNDTYGAMAGFIEGRVTWKLMADYWPTADEDPSASPAEAQFAGIWREMPKTVYSRTLQEAGWNSTIVRELDADEVRAWKAHGDGDFVVGGADLGGQFIRHGLVDEYRIYVHPVIVGAGRRLFPDLADPLGLRLVETRGFGSGVVLVRHVQESR